MKKLLTFLALTKSGHINLFSIQLYTAIGLLITAYITASANIPVMILIGLLIVSYLAKAITDEILLTKEKIIKKQNIQYKLTDDPVYQVIKDQVHDLERLVDAAKR